MASGTASKRNGGMSWLLGICGTLLTALAVGSFALLWSMSADVSAIAASVSAIGERVDRQDVRWTRNYDNLDNRLRDVELGER